MTFHETHFHWVMHMEWSYSQCWLTLTKSHLQCFWKIKILGRHTDHPRRVVGSPIPILGDPSLQMWRFRQNLNWVILQIVSPGTTPPPPPPPPPHPPPPPPPPPTPHPPPTPPPTPPTPPPPPHPPHPPPPPTPPPPRPAPPPPPQKKKMDNLFVFINSTT